MSEYRNDARRSEGHQAPAAESGSIDPLNVIRLLRSAGGALLAQASLHGQLARVEWAEEKERLLRLLVAGLVAMACALCVMLFVGVLVLALSWDTAYRVHAVVGLIVFFSSGIAVAVACAKKLSARGAQSFAATRQELAADIELIKARL